MTAKHVVTDYLNQFEVPGSDHQSLDADFFGFQYQAPDANGNVKAATFVRVRRMWLAPSTDVAFLELDGEFRKRLPLSALPVEVGSKARAIGFHESKAEILRSESTELPMAVRHQLRTEQTQGMLISARLKENWDLVVGSVVEVYPEKRDGSDMGNFPSFYIDTQFHHGMSGGPVLNHEHAVCGVVSSGSGMTFGDSAGPLSLAAMVWAAMDTIIDLDYPGRPESAYPILQLALDNYIRMDHLDLITARI